MFLRQRAVSASLTAILVLVLAPALSSATAPGDLDTTFDGDGRVTTDFGTLNDACRGLALQSDGRIVAAGWSGFHGDSDFALARYDTDGSLDTTFDSDGRVTTDVNGRQDYSLAVAIQSDGKIVAAGSIETQTGQDDFGVVRYNTDGSLDTTFDGDGKVSTDFSANNNGTDQADSMAIQSDGKIVAAGRAQAIPDPYNDFALARYNPDGSLDTTFDADGKLTIDFGGSDEPDVALGVAVQPDGRIVAVGHTGFTSDQDFAIARFDSDGGLDSSFGTGGKVSTEFSGSGSDEIAYGVSVQSDGKLVVAGWSGVDFAVARYEAGPPLAVQLANFGATRRGHTVLLEWATLSEIKHAGFRVLRQEPDGALTTLTRRLIPSRSPGGELGGSEYRFTDWTAPLGATRYWLEDVDSLGNVTRHGPAVAPPVTSRPVPLPQPRPREPTLQ